MIEILSRSLLTRLCLCVYPVYSLFMGDVHNASCYQLSLISTLLTQLLGSGKVTNPVESDDTHQRKFGMYVMK